MSVLSIVDDHSQDFPRVDPRPVERVKIYGERKTGTTFMADLLRRNFAVPLLSGTPDRQNRAERERLMEAVAREPPAALRMVLERIADRENRASLTETLGWKHMFPPIALLQRTPELLAGTLFVVTVKHPVFWALSFHRKPIDTVHKRRKCSFSQFLRQPFVPTLRDNVEPPYYLSPMELYADKVEGYRQLSDSGMRLVLARYEEVIADVSRFLDRLTHEHGLERRSEEPIIREVSTNRRDANFEDYQQRYRLDRVRETVSDEDWDFIVAKFGQQRLNWLGYSVE